MVAIATALVAALPETADAQRRARPETKWCLRGPTGGQACLYHTLEQCRKAAHGTGGVPAQPALRAVTAAARWLHP